MHFAWEGGGCMWCRVGGVGARSRKREGLGYRLVRKHARTENLGLLISSIPSSIKLCLTTYCIHITFDLSKHICDE